MKTAKQWSDELQIADESKPWRRIITKEQIAVIQADALQRAAELFSKQALEDLIAACEHNQFRHELRARCNELAARLRQLLHEAFQNEKG